MRRGTRRSLALAALAAALVVGGCGDDGGDGDDRDEEASAPAEESTTTTDAAVEDGDDGSDDAAVDDPAEAIRACIDDAGYRIVDDNGRPPRFGAGTELQIDTGVPDAPSHIGVFVYASEEEAVDGEVELTDAGASTTEVLGSVVVTGSLQDVNDEFAAAADDIRACVTG